MRRRISEGNRYYQLGGFYYSTEGYELTTFGGGGFSLSFFAAEPDFSAVSDFALAASSPSVS